MRGTPGSSKPFFGRSGTAGRSIIGPVSRRILGTVGLSAALLVTCLAATASADGVQSHPVDLLWTPDEQDTAPSSPTIHDWFDSTGSPFGAKPVETRTPRNQQFENTKRGKWFIYLPKGSPTQNPGICKGTFEITKNYVETTATSQTVTYDGELRLDGCTNTAKFRRAQPGRLGKVTGRSVCGVGSCSGGLRIRGRIRF
jgi:hypothetical protein